MKRWLVSLLILGIARVGVAQPSPKPAPLTEINPYQSLSVLVRHWPRSLQASLASVHVWIDEIPALRSVTAVAAPLGADTPGPVKLDAQVSVGGGVAPIDAASVQGVARLHAGDRSPDTRRWLASLSVEQLTQMLRQTPRSETEHRVADLIAEALVVGHGMDVDAIIKLGEPSALKVAGYLRQRQDPRAVDVYRALTAGEPSPPEQFQAAAMGLALYWKEQGEYARAAAVLQQAAARATRAEQRADYLNEAARCYRASGREADAERMMIAVEKQGRGWMWAVARMDQAQHLSQQGNPQAAIAAAREVQKQLAGNRSPDAAAAAVLVASYLAQFQARIGDREAAHAGALQAMAMANGCLSTAVKRRQQVESLRRMSQRLAKQTLSWEEAPVRVSPARIVRVVRLPAGSRVIALGTVTVEKPVAVELTCSESWLQPLLMGEWRLVNTVWNGEAYRRSLVVRPKRVLAPGEWRLTVMVSHPRHPAAAVGVQVTLRVVERIGSSTR